MLVSLTLTAWAVRSGGSIPFSQQWPLFEALRNTSAIVFAVVGAWLAIIYPEQLKVSIKGSEREEGKDRANLTLLLTPVVMSSFLLVLLLVVGVAAPLMKTVEWALANRELMRMLSFLALVICTMLQVFIVVIAIAPSAILLRREAQDEAEDQIEQQYGYEGHRQLEDDRLD